MKRKQFFQNKATKLSTKITKTHSRCSHSPSQKYTRTHKPVCSPASMSQLSSFIDFVMSCLVLRRDLFGLKALWRLLLFWLLCRFAIAKETTARTREETSLQRDQRRKQKEMRRWQKRRWRREGGENTVVSTFVSPFSEGLSTN